MNTHEWEKLIHGWFGVGSLEVLQYTGCPEGGGVAPASSPWFSQALFPLPLFFSSSFHPFLPWWLHHVGTALSMIYTVVRGVCVLCLLTAVQLLPFSRGPEPWGCIPSPSGDSHLRAVMYPAEEETPPREPDF